MNIESRNLLFVCNFPERAKEREGSVVSSCVNVATGLYSFNRVLEQWRV